MPSRRTWPIWSVVTLAALIVGGFVVRATVRGGPGPGEVGAGAPVPVEVAPVEEGPIERGKVFSGTLEPSTEFVVASKVGGRVERILVDLGDVVERGQVVATLDDAEYRQAVAQARAEVSVARAQRSAARKAKEIASRTFARVQDLRKRSVASDQELDLAMADKLEAEADVEVAEAQVQRANAALEAARIRQQYTQVSADWPEEDTERVVAARFADGGETVAQNARLLSIVDLDPLTAVVLATEVEYTELTVGQPVTLSTDAYPDETFDGRVSRVAPVFQEASRQARIELAVGNADARLRPGMFVRVTAVLERVEDAVIVPEDALVVRDGQDAVFVVSDDASSVALVPVEVGVQDQGRVQVIGGGVRGRVVTLGQQQLHDGTPITIPEAAP